MFHAVFTVKSLSEPFPDMGICQTQSPRLGATQPRPWCSQAQSAQCRQGDEGAFNCVATAKISSHPWEV